MCQRVIMAGNDQLSSLNKVALISFAESLRPMMTEKILNFLEIESA